MIFFFFFFANCFFWRQFAWNVKACFLGKIKNIELSSAEFAQRVVEVKRIHKRDRVWIWPVLSELQYWFILDNWFSLINIFVFLHKNLESGYYIKFPCRGSSNMYLQYMCIFSLRNKKNIAKTVFSGVHSSVDLELTQSWWHFEVIFFLLFDNDLFYSFKINR